MKLAPFGKQHRLRRRREFRRVFGRSDKPVCEAAFVVHYCANTLGRPRLGLAISRKVSGNAVRRNKVRRIVKESFRLCIPQLDALDFVVTGRAKLAEYSARELADMLVHAWSQCMKRAHG